MSKDKQNITHQFIEVVQISQETWIDRLIIPIFLAIGILYAAMQVLGGNWAGVILPGFSVVLLLTLATNTYLQRMLLGQVFNRKHAVYIALFWLYTLLWLTIFHLLEVTPAIGKGSEFFYVLLILLATITFRMLLTLFMFTPQGFRLFITKIPIWEQLLVAINEILAAGLLAYVSGGLLAKLFQPGLFSVYIDPVYTVGLVGVILLYYLGMQIMWVQRWNDWLSQNNVWVGLARFFAPLVLIVLTLEISRRVEHLADPRTANLLGSRDTDLAVLALAPIIWLMIAVVVFLVYTGKKGLRQRFLPDELLAEIPTTARRWLSSISDMDMLLILGFLATFVPVQLFLLEDEQIGVLDTLRQQIFQQGSALIDTSEQALAVLFTIPFYLLMITLLGLYAFVIGRSALSAEKRNQLVALLPNGFLIILIITLYLCAIPFTQVLTEGRLPKLPQDLGKILVFYVLIPLLLLYAHYFVLVRMPYARGQTRWRTRAENLIRAQLVNTETGINQLTRRINELERDWRDSRATQSPATTMRRLDILYRYVEINSERDTLNMNRLQVLGELQELTENDMEVPLSIAKLPTRVVRYGIPLLLGINIYQWAVVNGGLREITNNPNINIVEFFQIILQQAQF
jgi:hypothetical protein